MSDNSLKIQIWKDQVKISLVYIKKINNNLVGHCCDPPIKEK